MGDDRQPAHAARVHGVGFTVAVVHDAASQQVFERAGIDVTVNPRQLTAEEIVRFAHDPRTQQVVMLEGDRFEVLDLTTQRNSEYVGLKFKDMPIRGALIGAIVRDGRAVFPRGDVVVLPNCGHNTLLFHRESIAQIVDRVRAVQETAKRERGT